MSLPILHPDPVQSKRESFAMVPHTACVPDLPDAAYRVLGACAVPGPRKGFCTAGNRPCGPRTSTDVEPGPAPAAALRNRAGKGLSSGNLVDRSILRTPDLIRSQTYSPAEVGPEEVCPAEVGLEEVRPAEVGLEEVHPAEVGLEEVRPAEVRPGKVRPVEVRPAEVGLEEVRPAEVRPGKVRPVEVRPGKVRPPRFAPVRFAPPRFAPSRFAPVRFAPSRFAPPRFAPSRFAPPRFAPSRFALTRSASPGHAPRKSALSPRISVTLLNRERNTHLHPASEPGRACLRSSGAGPWFPLWQPSVPHQPGL